MTDIEEIAFSLVMATERINKAVDDFRQTLSELAGCELDDWTFRDLEKYYALACKFYIDRI